MKSCERVAPDDLEMAIFVAFEALCGLHTVSLSRSGRLTAIVRLVCEYLTEKIIIADHRLSLEYQGGCLGRPLSLNERFSDRATAIATSSTLFAIFTENFSVYPLYGVVNALSCERNQKMFT